MTQIEFENQLREMRCQKGASVSAIAKMQSEVKEEIAGLQRQFDDIKNRLHRLQQERSMLGLKRISIEKEWADAIKKFTDDNYTTTRALENVSDWALINEFRSRGFHGRFYNEEKGQEYLDQLNEKLNGKDGKSE